MKSRFRFKTYLFILLAMAGSFRANSQFRVIGYLPNWNNIVSDANAIDYTKLTHLNIAFINPVNVAGDLGPTTSLSTVVQKAHDNNVKILMSLGGAGATPLWTNLLTDANRPAFVAKIVGFVNTYGFDGVDVDLEGSAIDANYEKFVTDLNNTLPAGILLTAAVATWESGRFTNAALGKFDFINIMSYDATGTWDPANDGPHSPYSFAVSDLYHWGTTRGIAAAKMTVGVPFYGYGFNTANTTAYGRGFDAIVAQYPGSELHDTVVVSANERIYYNGIPTIKNKTALALSSAGGIMIWEMTMDGSGTKSLLTAIDDVIQATLHNTNPFVSITSPNRTTNTESDIITITASASDPDAAGSIIKVAFFAGTLKIGEDATSPYSLDWKGAGSGTYYVTAKAYDNSYGVTTSNVDTIYITPGTASPFDGNPLAIPGLIEAENYDLGGNNISYYDFDLSNTGGAYRVGPVDMEGTSDLGGGYNVGWTKTGEWLTYNVNVTTTTEYDIKVRVATNLTGKKMRIEMDGLNVSGDIIVPNTTGWQKWQTITVPGVALNSGVQTMKIIFINGDINLNYVEFSLTSSVTATLNANSSLSNISVSPNPFNQDAEINFSTAEPGELKVLIYNEMGKEITTLASSFYEAGSHTLNLNSADMKSGLYFCRIIQGPNSKMFKLIKE